ncbi:hypothetical protein VTH82DRAFT_474 [Thermothelomyces myriococcoides]
MGKIVSGRGYTLSIKGRGSYAASLSPLLWVNREARHAALCFYHIRLPLPSPRGERVLYLNSEYDVLCVQPQYPYRAYVNRTPLRLATVLIDVLHDIRAYDYKDQGIAHLALTSEYWGAFFPKDSAHVTPEILHPVAAESFADMLRDRLRSVSCVVAFRYYSTRVLNELPFNVRLENWKRHHLSDQTFPMSKVGNAVSTFRWLAADPRQGVEYDLRNVPLADEVDTGHLLRSWNELVRAFGITGKGKKLVTRETSGSRGGDEDDNDDQDGGDSDSAPRIRFYICPTVCWKPRRVRSELIEMEGLVWPVRKEEEEKKKEEGGLREQLAEFLEYEAEEWLGELRAMDQSPERCLLREKGCGDAVDSKALALKMGGYTAVGMWLIPADAFQKCIDVQKNCYDVSDVRPGLFLFDV